jgi:hypothetical protein
VDSLNLPSYCPVGLREVGWDQRLSVLVDATEVRYDSGPTAQAHYVCACCDHRWSEDWPLLWVFGPDWRRRREAPVRLVAGVDGVRRRTAGQVEQDLWALRQAAV